jgi:diacylglycerol O-acyltransferase
VQQLNLIDSTMLATESPRTPNHLCMTNIYDPSTAPHGKPSFEQMMDKLEASLSEAPSLRRKLVHLPLELDRPYWIDDPDFDLEFHVRQLALPRPGDWRQFRTQVARLASRPLDLTRPPWEITIIDGLDQVQEFPPGCFATVMKVHHAAIDGQSGVELLNVIHDLDPATPFDADVERWLPEVAPSTQDLLRRAGVHALMNPVDAVRMLLANVSPLAREAVAARRRRRPGPKVERTRFNGRVSAHRTWEEARCSLNDMKRVKNLVPGASINDVCLSVVGGAMHSYLVELGEAPTVPLVSLVPVSTRTPEQAKAGGNQVSGMRVSLATDIADPIARVAAIHEETATKKAAQNGVAMPVLLEVARVVPGALIGAAVRSMSVLGGRTPPQSNTIVTNVPGSQVPLYFLGCQLVRSTGCVPLMDGVGLFHCVSSFNGSFMFMFTADRDLMPDPEPYRDHILRSIAEHIAAADAAEAAAAPPPRQPARRRPPAKRAEAGPAKRAAAAKPRAARTAKTSATARRT